MSFVDVIVEDKRGFGNIIYGAIGLTIFIILVASVVMPQIVDTNTSTWSAATVALWAVLPLTVVAAAIAFVVGKK